jgi:ankyrin repeat protein
MSFIAFLGVLSMKKLILLTALAVALNSGFIQAEYTSNQDLFWDAVRNDKIDQLKLALDNGVDVNAKNSEGDTALLIAPRQRYTKREELLFDDSKLSKFGSRPLFGFGSKIVWEYTCYTDIVGLLLDHGADVNAKDKLGWTVLHRAAFDGQKEMVGYLVTRGADLNAKNNNGWTPLHCAAFKGHKEVVDLLVARGADVSGEWRASWAYWKLA